MFVLFLDINNYKLIGIVIVMNTKTKVAGVELNSYVMNASGPNDSTFKELEIIANSTSSGIMMKSCTIKQSEGNPKPRYVRLLLGSIQSMGLPNLGYKEYIKFASDLKKYNKPIIASVAGFCIDDYQEMVKAFQNSDVDLIEINLSCPNIENHSQIGYNFEESEKLLTRVSNLGNKPIGLKLPPYFDYVHQEKMAKIIKKYDISFITSINSMGNCLIIDSETETPIIKPKKGFGALCGDYIKYLALGNVRNFYELLNNKVSIFGVGGIKTGTDAFEFLLAGADAVQVATIFEKQGPSCFERINKELEEILKRKEYNNIDGVKGNLKYL